MRIKAIIKNTLLHIGHNASDEIVDRVFSEIQKIPTVTIKKEYGKIFVKVDDGEFLEENYPKYATCLAKNKSSRGQGCIWLPSRNYVIQTVNLWGNFPSPPTLEMYAHIEFGYDEKILELKTVSKDASNNMQSLIAYLNLFDFSSYFQDLAQIQDGKLPVIDVYANKELFAKILHFKDLEIKAPNNPEHVFLESLIYATTVQKIFEQHDISVTNATINLSTVVMETTSPDFKVVTCTSKFKKLAEIKEFLRKKDDEHDRQSIEHDGGSESRIPKSENHSITQSN